MPGHGVVQFTQGDRIRGAPDETRKGGGIIHRANLEAALPNSNGFDAPADALLYMPWHAPEDDADRRSPLAGLAI